MEGGLLLDVVVGKSAAVLELLAGEDKALLVGGDALLVLDLSVIILPLSKQMKLAGRQAELRGDGTMKSLCRTFSGRLNASGSAEL